METPLARLERLDRRTFRTLFEGRAVVFTDLPPGGPRDLAAGVNGSFGPGDATLRTRAEIDALFDVVSRLGTTPGRDPVEVRVHDTGGSLTPAGRAVTDLLGVSIGKAELFAEPMLVAEVTGWPGRDMRPDEPVVAPAGARLTLSRIDPHDSRPLPHDRGRTLYSTTTFSLVNSGNRTKHAPKRSWKVDLSPGGDDDRLVGMARLNVKSMVNDPSQQREALAWWLFGRAGVPAARHTYVRFGIDGAYYGLFSLIEQVDKRFLGDRFGSRDDGTLYKAYCGDLGCATLERRRGADGDDGGRQYRSADPDNATYALKSHEDDSARNTYEDLAELVRVVDGAGLPGGDARFAGDAYRASVEQILDVPAFLRWASVNLLLGSWDNYFATPANYYLYNGGRTAADGTSQPFFTFVPWDYDNSFGIDYVGQPWHETDLLDWPASTERYWHSGGARPKRSAIPLVTNLLANHDLAQYYLDHVEHLLDGDFSTDAICRRMGTPDGDGLWQRVSPAAYLESTTPYGPAFTGRVFSNDEVFRAGYAQNEIRHGEQTVPGIYHYVRMRSDAARHQLAALRRSFPSGASTASFPAFPARFEPPT